MEDPSPSKPSVVVLGAGIIGLTTALQLSRDYHVTVIAEHLPGDLSIAYTSPWAGGHWRSHAHSGPEDAECREWDAVTYRAWVRWLVEASGGPATGTESEEENWRWLMDMKGTEEMGRAEKELGLGIKESVMYWSEEDEETRDGGKGLWWRDLVYGFEVLGKAEMEAVEKVYEKVVFAARYWTICINVPRHLMFLKEQVESRCGRRLIRARIRTDAGVEGVIHDASQVMAERGGQRPEAVVLATGLLSRNYLLPEEASKLVPVRGQTLLVNGESSKVVTHVFASDEIGYVIPRPGSGTTIIGGSKEVGNWNEHEDKELTTRIIKRAKGLIPELLDPSGEFEVLSVQAGRRPGRKGGPRVELDTETISGVKVVHAYGHAGAGYQNSIGSALKVEQLLKSTLL